MWQFLAIGLFGIACFAGGWLTYRKFGAKAEAVRVAVTDPPKP